MCFPLCYLCAHQSTLDCMQVLFDLLGTKFSCVTVVGQECSEYIWDENITFKKFHCNISLQNDQIPKIYSSVYIIWLICVDRF